MRAGLTEPIAVGVLLFVAAAAMAVGALIPSMVAAAIWGFGLTSTALVAYGVSRLRILREVELLLKFWRGM